MKIAGVVNNYKEAKEIEEIVKVFTIEKRIIAISSLRKESIYKNNTKPDINISSSNDITYSDNIDNKDLQNKNNEDFKPVFNVRGLI